MENEIKQSAEQGSFFQRHSNTLKGVIVLLLTLVLMIPTSMVSGLIYERQSHRNSAIHEVSEKWARTQTITGPILLVPYEITHRNKDGEVTGRTLDYLQILPESLETTGNVAPQIKHRGIYEVVLYNADIDIKGSYKMPDMAAFVPSGGEVLWEKAAFAVGLSDLRGLEAQPAFLWAGKKGTFEPGYPDNFTLGESGVSAPVTVNAASTRIDFSLQIKMKGSGSLFFTPVGKTNTVQLQSTWADPKFTGAFLPDASDISESGFTANWNVLHMNRSYPQVFDKDMSSAIRSSAFGMDFLLPVDNYAKSERSIKYAILFIGLTFLMVFFMEMRQRSRVHPFQYALIGISLIIFYTLLVSISEHLSFNTAYLIAAGMTTVLIALFAISLFENRKAGLFTGAVLGLLYGFLFVTLQSQDYALLIGSLGLFFILAAIMYFSRRINMYGS